MTREQKTVAKGAVLGVLGMMVLTWLFYTLLPASTDVSEFSERITYALRWNAVAVLPLFVMLATIGNRRFLGGGINPLKETKDEAFIIDGRVVTNTLEQTLVFIVGALALATFLSAAHIKLIAALTLVFVIARLVFWFGYRKHYLYRAPGMAATYYLNVLMLITVVTLLLRSFLVF